MVDPHTQLSDDNPYRAATANAATSPKTPSRAAAFARELFSPRGRIPRSHWWACQLGWYALILMLNSFVDAKLISEDVINVALILLFWPVLVNHIKRWHDLERPGWWCLILLVPAFGFVVTVLGLGFYPGTTGPNLYGDDPLQ